MKCNVMKHDFSCWTPPRFRGISVLKTVETREEADRIANRRNNDKYDRYTYSVEEVTQ